MITKGAKKLISYFLVVLIIFFTGLALLDIWEIIDLENVMRKIFLSLLVILGAVAVVTFIFSVIVQDNGKENSNSAENKV